jgi:alanine-glyoxylate transaminase/serine-glyoxylate transaminase/serine-pyruvate transaminase
MERLAQTPRPLNPPQRILMSPGPTNLPPQVVEAMVAPLTGHKDPYYLDVMDDVANLLRYVFQTHNSTTLAVQGTGGAGMEASLVNLVESGDTVLVGVAGLFGQRIVEIAGRCGARVVTVEAEWGRPVDPDDLRRAALQNRPKVIAIVHGETSTGVEQPMQPVVEIARQAGTYLVVDTVATLGGIPVHTDDWGVDFCYSGSQKCLSAPPGLAPVTVSDRAMHHIRNRSSRVRSWYFDLSILEKYWTRERVYHHTAPVVTMYALREALRLIYEEGLEQRFHRHSLHSRALLAGILAMGLEPLAEEGFRLTTVCAIRVPSGIDEARVRADLLNHYNIEISGGLGPLSGKIWRIGIMGHSAQRANIMLVLAALEESLRQQGYPVQPGAGVAAASAVYAEAAAAVPQT